MRHERRERLTLITPADGFDATPLSGDELLAAAAECSRVFMRRHLPRVAADDPLRSQLELLASEPHDRPSRPTTEAL